MYISVLQKAELFPNPPNHSRQTNPIWRSKLEEAEDEYKEKI
jgi:hypothetical protein